MLELLKKQNPISLAVIILYAFTVRSIVFFTDVDYVFDYSQPFSFLTDIWCLSYTNLKVVHYFITTSIVVSLSLFFTMFLRTYKITDRLGYLPALFFILLSAMFPSYMIISNEFIAFLFFCISAVRLLQSVFIEETDVKVFDAAFFLSVASLFYKPLLPLLLMLLFAIIVLKSVQIKAIVYIVLGWLIPYFLLGVYMFATDRFTIYIAHLTPQFFQHATLFKNNLVLHVIKLIAFGICVLLGLIKAHAVLSKSMVSIRKFYSLMLIYLLFCIPLFLFCNTMNTTHFLFLVFPLNYYILNFVKDMRKTWISELIHVALFVLIIISNIL